MFDFKEYYSRMANRLPNDCKVVEIGVAAGNSALYLAKKLNELGKNFTLYMVDNMDYGGMEQIVEIYENIIESGLGKSIKVIPKDSIEASKKFNDNSLDFVFLDSSHELIETRNSCVSWYPKLKDGAIFSGHDAITSIGVSQAINEIFPKTITREPIDEPEQKQVFEPEILLNIENTDNGFGIFWVKKIFYWHP